jgi:HlyD family type I secretion membrane fusion protein
MKLPKLPSWLSRRGSEDEDFDAQAVESPTAEVLAEKNPVTERGMLYFLVFFLAALLVFSLVVNLDRIVTGTGRLVPIQGALTVQPLNTQIITHVLVKVGDIVHKGQVLAVCDSTFAQADSATLEDQVADFDAQVRRREAEEKGVPFVAKPGKHYDKLQAQIFLQRQAEYRANVANYDQQIAALEAQASKLRADISQYTSALKLAKEIETMYAKLVKDSFVSQLQYVQSQQQVVQTEGQLSDAKNELESAVHQLEALKQQRAAYIEKWRDDNLAGLVSARSQLDAAQQGLVKADHTTELVNLVSPADAVVTRIPVLTTGSVANSTVPLFNLVPLDAPLEAEVSIDSLGIGYIRVGDPVNIKFDAYEFLEHGSAEGVVKTFSQDAFTDVPSEDVLTSAGGNQSFMTAGVYDARITITGLHLYNLPPHARLVAGMAVEADIIVGQRSIFWYLLGGALRSGADSMHEP